MPATEFICPDGEKVSIEECLKHEGCRLKKRCMSRSSLAQIGAQRTYSPAGLVYGKQIPSTTQLLNGTMEEFLKITQNYPVRPQQRAFAAFGTGVHSGLEKFVSEGSLGDADLRGLVSSVGVSGLPDLIEQEFGETILTDYKTTSYYKVKKALEGEIQDWAWQLNHYRLIAVEQGFQVDRLRIQVFIRDWSERYAATCPTPIMCLDIPFIDLQEVKDFFQKKKADLLFFLKQVVEHDEDVPVPGCSAHENWDGRKCQKYCDVAHLCPARKV